MLGTSNTSSQSSRTDVCVYCSSEDKKYSQELKKHFEYYRRKYNLDVWDDTRVLPGSMWRQEMMQALQSARVVVLLISVDFFASNLVAEYILPQLLTAARQKKVPIINVILRYCDFESTELAQFRPVNSPSHPLAAMKRSEQEAIWTAVAKLVREIMAKQTETTFERLFDQPETLKTVEHYFFQWRYMQDKRLRGQMMCLILESVIQEMDALPITARDDPNVDFAEVLNLVRICSDPILEFVQRLACLALERRDTSPHDALRRWIKQRSSDLGLQEYPAVVTKPVSAIPSFMNETWYGFAWTAWLPLNSPEHPSGPGMYRIRAVQGNEIFYIGSTQRNLKERIGDLHYNIMKDATQMPFGASHCAAPSLWAWRDATGVDFECSATPVTSDEKLDILVHYLLWRYRLERGSSTLANHGRFHPHYTKSKERKTGVRGYRLPEGQSNRAGDPSFPPLPLTATPPERAWMGLTWSECYPLRSDSLQHISTSPGTYKILDPGNNQLLATGTSMNLRSRFQAQSRENWKCPDPVFSFASLHPDILPHQLTEVENDLKAGYYAQARTTSNFPWKNLSSSAEEIQSNARSGSDTSPSSKDQ